jgi:hypothetical protein
MNVFARRFILALTFILGLTWSAGAGGQKKPSPPKAVAEVPLAQIQTAIEFYLSGDFNGDGHSDIAVLVKPEEGKAELKKHGVSFVDINPYSATNGALLDPASMREYCLGTAIIHGTADGWKAAAPAAKYLFYDCFSSFRLFPKSERIRRGRGSTGAPPVLPGDAIHQELASGATAVVYWNGKTYRGFGLRGGD